MTIKINPDYKALESFIKQLPASFELTGEMVYEARNQLKMYRTNCGEVIVKRFKQPHLINRIAYTFLRKSKAERAYEYALTLLNKGINSPTPIAYIIEKKNGLIAYSYFVSVFESSYNDIRKVMEGEEDDEVMAREVGRYAAFIHSKGVLHRDMSPGNILYKITDGQYHFTLIDINRMEFHNTIPLKKRYKSFNKLTSFKNVLTTVATEYAKNASLNVDESVKEILKYSDNFFNSYRVKRRK